jgi:hypothetical protein
MEEGNFSTEEQVTLLYHFIDEKNQVFFLLFYDVSLRYAQVKQLLNVNSMKMTG